MLFSILAKTGIWPGFCEQYTGEFFANEMNGEGVYTWPNGDRYKGEFRDNKMNGSGVYQNADGSTYTGEFRDGKKHEKGILGF